MNSLPQIKDKSDLLQAIKSEAMQNGNLSIRGVSRLAGVDDTAIIRGADFKSQKLAESLIEYGFNAADLAKNGFPPNAVILTLEYFAYESKAKAEGAKTILRTFGTIGLLTTLGALSEPQAPVQEKASHSEVMIELEVINTCFVASDIHVNLIAGIKLNHAAKRVPTLTEAAEEGRKLLAANTSTELLLTPSLIGERLGISAIKVNKILIELELQVKAVKKIKGQPDYTPTDKGRPYSANTIATGRIDDNTTYQHLKWKEDIIAILQEFVTK